MIIDFPQFSTMDQSFYTNQTGAFVGPGYLLGAAELAPKLEDARRRRAETRLRSRDSA